jgi:hypothetical protein
MSETRTYHQVEVYDPVSGCWCEIRELPTMQAASEFVAAQLLAKDAENGEEATYRILSVTVGQYAHQLG